MGESIVSVVMPVYNAERYLADAIESILVQSYSNFELLIFDDGSTDRSREIIAGYAARDGRIIPDYSETNRGYVVHLNTGIERAKGSLIARMDGDDISTPERLALQVNYLQSHPDVSVVGSSVVVIDEEGIEGPVDRRNSLPAELFWQSFFTNPLAHPTVMFRKSVIREAGLYDPKKMPAEDFDLWVRVLRISRMANISAPLLKYRIHERSVSKLKRQTQIEHSTRSLIEHWVFFCNLRITDEIARFLKNYHKGEELAEPELARGAFSAIAKLYRKAVMRNGFADYVEKDAFGKLYYLASISRKSSFFVTIELVSLLMFFFPWRMCRRLIAS